MGEKGEATLGKSFSERFGSGGTRNIGSPSAATVGKERRESRQRRMKKKGTGALLRYKGANKASALHANMACPSDPTGSIGRHHPWRPSMHRGARMVDTLCLGPDME
jgi:hypothetical protein